MKNIINKIREVYPVSDNALQVLQAKYDPKNRYLSTFFAFEQMNFASQAVSLPTENIN